MTYFEVWSRIPNIVETVLLERAEAEDLSTVLDPSSAKAILEVGRLVDNYFVFTGRGPRKDIPAEYKAFFEANPGQCDKSVAVFRELTKRSDVRNLNMIARYSPSLVNSNYIMLGGHTIAEISTSNGSVGIDPTYGLVLITKHSRFSPEVFVSKDYSIYRLYDYPADFRGPTWPGYGLEFYQQMANVGSEAKWSGERITARSNVITLSDEGHDLIRDVPATFGTWLGHIGQLYEPVEHVWSFRVPQPGRYRFLFNLAPASPNPANATHYPPVLKVATNDAVIVNPIDAQKVEGDRFIVTVDVTGRELSINLISQTVGARLLQSIEIIRLSRP